MAKYSIPWEIAFEYDSDQLEDMKFQDLQRTASALTQEARRRVKELKKSEKELGRSQALAHFESFRDSNYSARYKGKDALLLEIQEVKKFLSNESSTRAGFEKEIEELDDRLGMKTDKDFRENFWDVYNKFFDESKLIRKYGGSEESIERIKDLIVHNRDEKSKVINWDAIKNVLNKEATEK